RIPPRQRDVAVVFQTYALYPHLSVRQNLEFPLRVRRVATEERNRRVEQAAELLGIKKLLDRRPRELSGGEQQRVAIGRAVVRRPRLFLFDEPLSNLDARLRGRMRVELAALRRSLATTALYVTHDQAEAMTLGEKVVVLNQGRIAQIGAPRDIYERPANLFVAGFIGSPPMNLLEGQIESAPEGTFFSWIGGRIPAPRGLRSGAAVFGVRPEDLQPGEGPMTVGVRLVEDLGAERFVYGETNGIEIVYRAREGEAAEKSGDSVSLSIRPGQGHWFVDGVRYEDQENSQKHD
ncbi:MAG: ABC transporter ATP-binding protein, partial [Candidatus Binatia bacterium]